MNDAVLRAEEVHKSYDGLEVLRGVSVEVGRGEVKVIIGPSGSGKSTLLRCLALLEPVDSGAVYLEDSPLSDLRRRSSRSTVPRSAWSSSASTSFRT